MKNISDLFVSYKAVNEPTISIPVYTPDEFLSPVVQTPSVADRVENTRTRIQNSPTLKFVFSGTNEKEYSVPEIQNSSQQIETSTSSSRSNLNYGSTADFIKSQEGFVDHRYKDAGGSSIGYGFYNNRYYKGDHITREEADKVLDRILKEQEDDLSKYPVWNTLNQNQKTAIHSYMYNVGGGSQFKRMREALQSGNLNNIKNAISITTSLKKPHAGLIRRRRLEKQLFDS